VQGKLLVILIPHGLKLVFFIAVLVDLGLELCDQPLDSFLELLDLWLLEVENLAFNKL
jgi:hypothetical protein